VNPGLPFVGGLLSISGFRLVISGCLIGHWGRIRWRIVAWCTGAHNTQVIVCGKVVVVEMTRGLLGFAFASGASHVSKGLRRREAKPGKQESCKNHPDCAFHLVILRRQRLSRLPAVVRLNFSLQNS